MRERWGAERKQGGLDEQERWCHKRPSLPQSPYPKGGWVGVWQGQVPRHQVP